MAASKTEKTSPVRHAIARSTGATTWTRKTDEGEWKSTCLNHGAETTAPNRGTAWKTGSHPQDFCAKCKAIAASKADKITGDRLDIPDAKPVKKAAPKKATTTTKRATSKTAKKEA